MLGAILRGCSRPCLDMSVRNFSSTPAVQIRRQSKVKIRIPSKKAMAAKVKRRAAVAEKLDSKAEKLPLHDAIQVLRALEVTSPNSIYELLIKTEVGNGLAVPKGRVSLPRQAKASKDEKILVFAEGKQAEEAKRAGAHVVGGPELIESVLSNRIRPTTVLCTPDLIRAITPRLGRFLGPLGLMPSERRGTVIDDVAAYLQKLRGTSEWRADKAGTIRAPIAVMDFPVEDVIKNVRHFLSSVRKATGNSKEITDRNKAKGSPRPVTPIKKVVLSSRQGPGIRIADI